MTAHSKALPRLFDELNSSHQIVHGASSHALSVGFAMVNASDTGYDGLAIVVVRMRNDGSPVELVDDSPAPGHSSVWDYEQAILRVAGEYDAAFWRV